MPALAGLSYDGVSVPYRSLRSVLSVALVAAGLAVLAPAAPAAAAIDPPTIGAYVGGGDRGDGGLAVNARMDAQSATTLVGDSYVLDGSRLRKVDEAGEITAVRSFPTAPRKVVATHDGVFVLRGTTITRYSLAGGDTGWSADRPGVLDFDVARGDTVYAVTTDGVWKTGEGVPWTRVAGGGANGWGDGGAATDATLTGLRSVAVTRYDVYVGQGGAVRHISETGVLATVAGSESAAAADSGDGGLATAASVRAEYLGVADTGEAPHTVYVSHGGADGPSLRRFAVGGDIDTFATPPASCASPRLGSANVWRVLVACGRVYAYDQLTSTWGHYAGHDGTGSPDGAGFRGSWESEVHGVAPQADGRPYWSAADTVRRLTPAMTIETVAGGGDPADGWGDGPAAGARLRPRKLASAPDGSVYVADQRVYDGARVRRIKDGVVSTVAGGGSGAATDGGSATAPAFSYVYAVAVDGAGAVWFADQDRAVWRIVDGLLDHVATLPAHTRCCDLAYDPYGARMLAVVGSSVQALGADGTLTEAAALPGPTAAAGPGGSVFSSSGWVRRGAALTRFFGAGDGDNGGPARTAYGIVEQAYVDAEGLFVFADTQRRQVRVIDALPAPVVPDVGTPEATPGPGNVSFAAEPHAGYYTMYGTVGATPPSLPDESAAPALWDWSSESGDGLAFTVDGFTSNSYLSAVPYSFTFFAHTPGTYDYLVLPVTVTPLVDDVPPAQVQGLALDVAGDTVTFTEPATPDFARAEVRWAYGTTPPATRTAGNAVPVPPLARYSDIAFSVFSVDHADNVSPPVSIGMPKLMPVATHPLPAFAGYDSDEPNKRLTLFHHDGEVRYAAGDVAPALPSEGLAPDCACAGGPGPTGKVVQVDGVTYGQHYAFAVFRRSGDGLHYYRGTYVTVFGGTTIADTLTMASTPASVVTGALVTLKGTVKQGVTHTPRALSRIELWSRSPGGAYARVAVARTSALGAYAFSVRPRTHTYYQVRTGVADAAAPAMSSTATRLVRATPVVGGRLSASKVTSGTRVRVYGSIVPAGKRTLVLQRLTSTGWRAVVTKTTDGYGKTYYDVARTRGTYRYRWTAPASATLNAATGATLTLTVT